MWLLGLSLSLAVFGLESGSIGVSSLPQHDGQDDVELSAVMYPLQHKARRKARMTKARTALIEEHGLKQSAEEVASAVRDAQQAVARAAAAVGVESEEPQFPLESGLFNATTFEDRLAKVDSTLTTLASELHMRSSYDYMVWVGIVITVLVAVAVVSGLYNQHHPGWEQLDDTQDNKSISGETVRSRRSEAAGSTLNGHGMAHMTESAGSVLSASEAQEYLEAEGSVMGDTVQLPTTSTRPLAAERLARGIARAQTRETSLCPLLVVPAGCECVLIVKAPQLGRAVLNNFTITDTRQNPILDVVFDEGGPIRIKSLIGIVLGSTEVVGPRSCKILGSKGELFGWIRYDEASDRYNVLSDVENLLLSFDGPVDQFQVCVHNPENKLVAATERAVLDYEPSPCFKLRMAPKCDAGLVVTALVAIGRFDAEARPA
mmetsp:Transcript_16560/g.36621  ORF Transcript_16560/g.36621 Transcript_16560/m.36621 type:complete len:432 (+) Transcript_16560:156-1451(+)